MPPIKVLPATRPAAQPRDTHEAKKRLSAFALSVMVLCLLFGRALIDLVGFASESTLYSHIPLIPVIVVWLLWMRRSDLPGPGARATTATIVLAGAGATLAVTRLVLPHLAGSVPLETSLSLAALAFVLLVTACVAWFIGRRFLQAAAFPLFFLIFMVPLPAGAVDVIENVLQHGSAAVAWGLYRLVGTTMFYQDLTFQLPGIALHVAPECSGIHSTLALLMVSLIAGNLFLRSPLRAGILAVAVLPLALLRNGFRIFVIGELCVHRGAQMIDSPIHHQGGPVFFALSLIPFAGLLWLLSRYGRRPTLAGGQ